MNLLIIIAGYLVIIILYSALEALWNVAKFRPGRSIFTKWEWFMTSGIIEKCSRTTIVLKNDKKEYKSENLAAAEKALEQLRGRESTFSPFHMIKGLFVMIGIIALLEWHFPFCNFIWIHFLWWKALLYIGWYCVVVYAGYYLVSFPLFFHEIWTHKDFRDLHKQSFVWNRLYYWR